MNLKIFSITASIIIGIIITTIITLACVKIDNGLNIDDPSKIIVYAKTTVGVEYSMDTTPSKYKNVKECYEEMTNLSILDYTMARKNIKQEPSQDINQKYETWQESNKTNNYCVELTFKDKQSIVVNINGNTKAIDFYALIMKVEKSSRGKEVALYFSTSEGTGKTYQSSPILVNAKQNKLFNFVAALEE